VASLWRSVSSPKMGTSAWYFRPARSFPTNGKRERVITPVHVGTWAFACATVTEKPRTCPARPSSTTQVFAEPQRILDASAIEGNAGPNAGVTEKEDLRGFGA
jgi:hypothetical protein